MLNWANMVTGIRVLLILVVAGLLYTSSFSYRLAALILVIIVIFMDSLDGYIARKYNFTTTAGTLIDITGDRIVELVLWIVLAERGIVHVVVPIIFLVRGIITDMIRAVKL